MLGIHAKSGTFYSLFVLQYSWVYMDPLELVFQLLVRLQFMYFQHNVYLSIVVRTNIYINMWSKTILGHPSWGIKMLILLWRLVSCCKMKCVNCWSTRPLTDHEKHVSCCLGFCHTPIPRSSQVLFYLCRINILLVLQAFLVNMYLGLRGLQ